MVAEYDRRLLVMLLMLFLRCSINDLVVKASQVPAMFVFGDSIVDTGNNNFINSIAKANYYPHGCDSFSRFPTGRFCNGKTVVEKNVQIVVTSLVAGEMLGIPDPATTGDKLSGGVSYASAVSGILDETGRQIKLQI
ncbi:GDSL esterase/lipase EXL3 [Heracleum sosnowskyi]|uniref:GDSL esterase/lipase EXL3 n=1 Tax=Heracleum sosnowskyi TaxID=360622 RepID=A0AAD8IV74_9APIA|nr:GDSL esterase/lipase EXL3 [Heracleum sosnowskyi]